MNKIKAPFKLFTILAFSFTIHFFILHEVNAATFNVTDATTLQSALATAESNNQDNTINLAAGTYDGGDLGYLMDNTSGHALTLSGHGQSDTFITGQGDVMTLGTNGPLTIQNLTFKDCQYTALVIPGSAGTNTNSLIINVHNVSFIHNGGSGLYINLYNGSQGGSVTVTDSTFDGNTSAGFYLNNTNTGAAALPLTFSRNTVINNTTHGIYAQQNGDGSDMLFDRNYSANNTDPWGAGLAVLADCHCKITATSNVIVNNTGNGTVAGVGVVLESITSDASGATLINFTNNTVMNNSEADTNAGGLLANLNTPNAVFNFYNNIFWNNSVHGGGNDGSDAYLSLSDYGSVNFVNNDIHSLLVDGDLTNYHASNTIDVDPAFQGGSGRLMFQSVAYGSPIVGKGSSSAPGLPTVDFVGDAIHNPPDLGAFTLHVGLAYPPSSDSSPSKPSSPVCTSKPSSPDLFQINTTNNSATLFFTPVSSSSNYQVSYGFDSNANQYRVLTNQGSSTGVLSYTINALPKSATMYFKVFAQNNCGQGNWSNVMSAKVTANKMYYKNFTPQIFPQKTTVLVPKTVLSAAVTPTMIQTTGANATPTPISEPIPTTKPAAVREKFCIFSICI